MSIQRMDGIGHFTSLADWGAKGHSGGSNVTISPTSGRDGRGGITVGLNATMWYTMATAQQTLFHHFAVYTTSRAAAELVAFRSATDTNCFLRSRSDGSIEIRKSASPFSSLASFETTGAGIVAETAQTNIIRNSTWHHIMVKCKIHASAGVFDVYVDGILVLSYSGNTYSGSGSLVSSQVGMGSNGGTSSVIFSDLFTCDDQGSLFNTYQGDVAVYEDVHPVDGDLLEWTRSTGAGTWSSHVDDNPKNDDTDYVSSSTLTQRVCFSFPTVSSALGTILAIKETVGHRKTEPTTAVIKLFSRSDDDVNHDGSLKPCTETYIFDERIFEQDLKDNSSWTAAKVNNTQLGIYNSAA